MISRWVTITLEILRTRLIATGGWCEECALPSVLELEHLVTVNGRGPRYLRGWWCDECRTGESEELYLE